MKTLYILYISFVIFSSLALCCLHSFGSEFSLSTLLFFPFLIFGVTRHVKVLNLLITREITIDEIEEHLIPKKTLKEKMTLIFIVLPAIFACLLELYNKASTLPSLDIL